MGTEIWGLRTMWGLATWDFEGTKGKGTDRKGGLYKKGLRIRRLGGDLWELKSGD